MGIPNKNWKQYIRESDSSVVMLGWSILTIIICLAVLMCIM